MIFDAILPRNAPITRKNETGNRFWTVPMMNAGVRVDHDTALKHSAVFCAVRVISETIACLPWHVYSRSADGSRQRQSTNNAETMLNHRPNPEMSAFSFKETLLGWALTWGNGYAEIVRDNANRPQELWPISPDRVEAMRDETGELWYEISNSRGAKSYLPAANVYHLHGLGFDGITGYSVISYASRTIGVGLAADEFSSSFFGNGATLNAVLETPERVSEPAQERLKKQIADKYQGPSRAFNTMVLEEGMKWHTVGIPAKDAQLIESKKFTVNDIARWFRVPPHKLGDLERATFSNIEESNIDFVTDTIMPWAIRLEQEADYKLVKANRLYTKLSLNALLRGKLADRSAFYREMWNLGVLSVNEIRQLEDMNPVEHGEKRFVQLNMTTLDKAGEEPEPAPETDRPDETDEPEDDALNAHRMVIADAVESLIRGDIDQSGKAAKRYKDRTELAEWADGWFANRKKYYRQRLNVPVTAMFNALHINVSADELIDLYIDRHVAESRHYLFHGEQSSNRADDAAQWFIDHAIDYRRAA